MRASFVAVAVVGAIVGTSALATGDSRGRGRSSGHSNSGGRSVGREDSSASSSRSGDTRQYRAAPRDSSNRGATTRYRTGGRRGSQGYRNYRSSPYRNRSHYGYRSYYRPGLSLYLGSPLYYDNYNYGYGAYSPEYYPETYAPAPYAPDYGYREPAEDSQDAGPEYDNRGEADGVADADGSGRLQLDVQPADATIYVDDQFHGTANNDTVLLLTPGRHTVELARPGFQSERRVVEVGTGEARSLSITLQPARR
jgi:PEGA domain